MAEDETEKEILINKIDNWHIHRIPIKAEAYYVKKKKKGVPRLVIIIETQRRIYS